MTGAMKLEVICVRCGEVRDLAESHTQVGTPSEPEQLLERLAELHGWQTVRGFTDGKRHGRCPRHAIRLEGGKA